MATVDLARTTLDPGLFSDNAPTMQAFYDGELGLEFFERLQHSETYAELFFHVPGGKLKIQASTEPMEPAVSGYRGLLVAREGLGAPKEFTDPDGLSVQLVPPGHRGVTQVGIVVGVPDVERQHRFYVEGMGATPIEGGVRVGDTQLFLEPAPGQGRSTPPFRRGFTYLTLIVHDCAATHRSLLDAGAEHSLRELRLADRCNFSWVRDPFGNWIEIVQYDELSGPLPPVPRLEDHWAEVERWREQAVPF